MFSVSKETGAANSLSIYLKPFRLVEVVFHIVPSFGRELRTVHSGKDYVANGLCKCLGFIAIGKFPDVFNGA